MGLLSSGVSSTRRLDLIGCAADRLRVTVARIKDAIELDRGNPKPRLQYDPAREQVRAIQGHSLGQWSDRASAARGRGIH